MTDNEIIKALECCMDEMGCKKGCPCFDPKAKGSPCTVAKKLELEKLTLDLINRQKAEIERLEAEIDKQYEQARTDILGNMADGGTSCYWCIEEHRARAIKEFAERLKEKSAKTDLFCNAALVEREYKITEHKLDNLVKEMVGEGE